MITAKSEQTGFLVRISNGKQEAPADAGLDKGGTGQGFRPHELLEAALASCMNMHVRMYAAEHSLPLTAVFTTVTLDRGHPQETVFHYDITLEGPLTDAQRKQVLASALDCPVRKTLSRPMSFRD
jgi:putative redox protein